MNRTGARAPVRRDVASGGGGRGQVTQEAQDACVRCDEIQGAQGAGYVEATSLASGRNADVPGARYFFADVWKSTKAKRQRKEKKKKGKKLASTLSLLVWSRMTASDMCWRFGTSHYTDKS